MLNGHKRIRRIRTKRRKKSLPLSFALRLAVRIKLSPIYHFISVGSVEGSLLASMKKALKMTKIVERNLFFVLGGLWV
jgi:hypothetical protein